MKGVISRLFGVCLLRRNQVFSPVQLIRWLYLRPLVGSTPNDGSIKCLLFHVCVRGAQIFYIRRIFLCEVFSSVGLNKTSLPRQRDYGMNLTHWRHWANPSSVGNEALDFVFDIYKANTLKTQTRDNRGKGTRVTVRKDTHLLKKLQLFHARGQK